MLVTVLHEAFISGHTRRVFLLAWLQKCATTAGRKVSEDRAQVPGFMLTPPVFGGITAMVATAAVGAVLYLLDIRPTPDQMPYILVPSMICGLLGAAIASLAADARESMEEYLANDANAAPDDNWEATTRKLGLISVNTILLSWLGLAIAGYWIDFAPSVLGFWMGTIIALIICTQLARWATALTRASANRRGSRSIPGKQQLAIAFTILAIAPGVWLGTTHALPGFYTLTIGLATEVEGEVNKQEQAARWGDLACQWRLKHPALDHAVPRHICISQEMFDWDGSYFVLSGKQSPLGTVFVSVKTATPPVDPFARTDTGQ